MFVYNTNKANCAIRNHLDKINSLPILQEVVQEYELSVKDLADILKSFNDLEIKSSNDRNYDEAVKSKYIYELVLTTKSYIDKYIDLENEAKLKRNYIEAGLIKTHQYAIMKEIKCLVTDHKSPTLININNSKLLVIDLFAILKIFKNLEKKAVIERKYDEADGAQYIHDILINKKKYLCRYIDLENEAKLKQNYNEAGLIKKFIDIIITDIKLILLIDSDISIIVETCQQLLKKNKDNTNKVGEEGDEEDDEEGDEEDEEGDEEENESKNLVNLTSLNLRYGNKNITDQGIKNLVNLTTLHMWNNINITDQGIKNLVNLRSLISGKNTNITDQGIKNLVNLTTLHMWNNTNITDQGIKNLVNLTSLDLSRNINITDQGIKNLVNLTSLDLSININITDMGIENLVNLTTLASGDDNITDQGIKNLVNLTSLDLWNNNNITDQGIKNLVKLKINI